MSEAVDGVFAELLAEARKVNAPPEPVKLEKSKAATGSKTADKKEASKASKAGSEGRRPDSSAA